MTSPTIALRQRQYLGYLRQLDPIPRFLNADEIARGLSPLNSQKLAVKAGKLLLHEIQDCLRSGNSFGLESTLSGTTYAKHLQQAKSTGFQIEIHYLWIPSPSLAISIPWPRQVPRRHRRPTDHHPLATRTFHANLPLSRSLPGFRHGRLSIASKI